MAGSYQGETAINEMVVATLGFSMSKWAEEDLVWAAVLGYTYDILSVSFTFEQTEADVIGWKLAGSVTL